MEQTVYADILFLINFSMDFLCFYISAKLLHRRLPRLRAIFASAFGGVYAVAVLFMGLVPPFELVLDIGVGFLMCISVFAAKKVKLWRLLVSSAVYIGVSAALGGIMTALFNMLNLLGFPFGALSESGDGMPVWLFALLSAASGAATLAGGRFFRKSQSKRTADIEITYKGKTVKLAAICDTGNLLRDPISGKSVVVADVSPLSAALPPAIIDAVSGSTQSAITSLPKEFAKDLRIIPSRTATGDGLLYALTPEKLTVKTPGESPHEVDALFAPAKLGASAGGFDALLPPELLV